MGQIHVPEGNTSEALAERTKIIIEFYQNWKRQHPSLKVFNRSLKDDINIRHISIEETARHAAKKYLSTLAVLQLDSILQGAVKITQKKIKDRSNQKTFIAMIIMGFDCPGIGRIKLTVGVRRKTLIKVQYCITALEAENGSEKEP